MEKTRPKSFSTKALIVAFVALLAIPALLLPSEPALANNHSDKEFYVPYGNWSGSWGATLCLPERQKTDRSYVYLQIRTLKGGLLGYEAMAYDGGPVDVGSRYYTTRSPRTEFMWNNVYEAGYRWATIQFTKAHDQNEVSSHREIRGVWSPDSVDSNGNPYI